MAIIVEDGTIVTGANSYVTTTELATYGTARGTTFTGDTEQLLHRAMDYLESQSFVGTKSTSDQPLQWPRSGVSIDGYEVTSSTIPTELKNAQLATAIAIGKGYDPLAVVERAPIRQKAGDLEVEYADDGKDMKHSLTITSALKKLLTNGGGSMTFNVSRM